MCKLEFHCEMYRTPVRLGMTPSTSPSFARYAATYEPYIPNDMPSTASQTLADVVSSPIYTTFHGVPASVHVRGFPFHTNFKSFSSILHHGTALRFLSLGLYLERNTRRLRKGLIHAPILHCGAFLGAIVSRNQ